MIGRAGECPAGWMKLRITRTRISAKAIHSTSPSVSARATTSEAPRPRPRPSRAYTAHTLIVTISQAISAAEVSKRPIGGSTRRSGVTTGWVARYTNWQIGL